MWRGGNNFAIAIRYSVSTPRSLAVSGASLDLNPGNYFEAILVANALGVLDRSKEAKAYWVGILEKWPDFTIENLEWFMKQGLLTDARVEPFVRGLKRARVED